MSGRKHQPLVPLFVDWLHSFIGVYEEFRDYPPPKMDFPRVTATTNCLMAMCLPKMSVQQAMTQSLPLVYFWVNVAEGTCDNFTEVASAITAQYAKVFPRIRVYPKINPPQDWLAQFLTQTRTRQANQRVLAHYSSPGLSVPGALEEFAKVLKDEALLKTTAFIFECDGCGALRECFEGLGKDVDTFAFFACDKNETLPKSNDLPIDIFSACLTSPARTALMWHSRRYYCFRNGPLKPLSMSFVEEKEGEWESMESVFAQIQLSLKHTVEAMAFQVLDSDSFLRLFRTDPVIAQLSVNFVLACRIMDFFGVHPRSYPELPSLAKNQLWSGFDLRLDAELFRLQQPAPDGMSFEMFLRKVIVSLRTVSEVSPLTQSFFPQISFMTSALSCPNTEIQESACSALARFLDRSANSIRSALHFPIVPQLFRLLKMQAITPSLLFCLCKVMCYEPALRDMGAGFLLQTAIPLLRTGSAQLALIVCLLFIRNSSQYTASFLQLKGLSYVMPLLLSQEPGVRFWALLVISVCVPVIKDTNIRCRLFESINKMTVTSSDEKTALYFCLSRFLMDFETPLRESIVEFMLSAHSEMCHVVRYQVVTGLSLFFAARPDVFASPASDLDRSARNVLLALAKDSHPMVANMACQIADSIGKQSVTRPSMILDGYCAQLLTQVHDTFIPNDTAASSSTANDGLVAPLVPKKKMIPALNLTASYTHTTRVTSNLSYVSLVPPNQVAFGDESGKINMKTWAGTDVLKTFTMGRSPVTCIRYLSNYTHPLLTAADALGNFVAFSLTSVAPYPVTAFQLFEENDKYNASSVSFDVDPVYGRLAAYRPGLSHQVRIFDVRAEQVLAPIDVGDRTINALGMILGTSNIGIVSDNCFQMFDLRVREPAFSVTLDREAIDFRVSDPTMLSFLVCTRDGHVESLDMRAGHEAGVVFDMHGSKQVDARSFDVHSLYQLAVVGHSRGLTMFDTGAHRSAAIAGSRKWFGGQLPIRNVSSVIYDKNPHLSFAACHNSNSIATFIEVLETE